MLVIRRLWCLTYRIGRRPLVQKRSVIAVNKLVYATPDWQMMKIDIGDVLWKHHIVTRPAVIDGGDALREMGAGSGADFQVVPACVKPARQSEFAEPNPHHRFQCGADCAIVIAATASRSDRQWR
jgi:hypothetical protein